VHSSAGHDTVAALAGPGERVSSFELERMKKSKIVGALSDLIAHFTDCPMSIREAICASQDLHSHYQPVGEQSICFGFVLS
jgi:hypothetical protein